MIVIPALVSYPVRKMTVHGFATHTLAPGEDSDIVWWNANDHALPFPWRINRSYPRAVNTYLASADTSRRSMSDLGPALQLWCVDAAGTDLFQLTFNFFDGFPGTYDSGITQRTANGLKFKFGALMPGTASVELGAPCLLMWDFLDETQTTPLPNPLQ